VTEATAREGKEVVSSGESPIQLCTLVLQTALPFVLYSSGAAPEGDSR
jgi:hypothetical protein